MSRLYIPLILFLLVILEGVALDLLPTKLVMNNLTFIPHWVLIFLFFIAIFYDKKNTYYSVLYAVLFGLLIDIVYTEIMGVYMFSYAIVTYLIAELKNFVHGNLIVTILLGIIGLMLADILIYLVYYTIGIANMNWLSYFTNRLGSTVIANTIFLIISYPLISRRLAVWKEDRLTRNETF